MAPRFASCWLLLALAAACSDDQPPAAAPSRVVRPRLQSPAVLDMTRQDLVVGSVHPERATPEVEVVAATRRSVVVDGEPLLACEGDETKSIVAPLPAARTPFTHATVRVLVRRRNALRVELLADGQPVSIVQLPLAPDERVQTIVAEFPLYQDTRACDALRVQVERAGPAGFGRIDLLAVPLIDRLPRFDKAPELIDIGDDQRRGVGLSSGNALEFTLDGSVGGEIGFSYGQPEALRRDGAPPELFVHLSSPGLPERQHVLPLERPGITTTWHWSRIPLGDFEKRRTKVRFELHASDEREAICALTEPKVHVPDAEAPTVVLVTSDTHRADKLGVSGGRVQTPVIDALAARGVRFERAFSATNVTIPSHAALLTGEHPRDTRVLDNDSRLADEASTLAEVFREAGWQTIAAVSAAHLSHEWSGLGQGFDRMLCVRTPDRRAGETVTYLNRSLEELDGRPLFVWLHLFDAHTPYLPPSGFVERYYKGDAWSAALPAPAIAPEHMPSFLPEVRDLAYVEASYDGETTYLDGELARLFERPRVRRGIVAFTADHGESFGEHGVYWDHAELYPQTVRVPLVLAWPGAPGGTVAGTPVLNTDIGRTLLDLAGLRERSFPGRNLRLAMEPGEGKPLHLLSSHGTSAAIVRWPWMLVLGLRERHPDAQSIGEIKPAHLYELYQLEKDPECAVDLRGAEPAMARELRAQLVEWLRASRDLGWKRRNTRDGAMQEALQALGYAGGEDASGAPDELFPAACSCAQCVEAQ